MIFFRLAARLRVLITGPLSCDCPFRTTLVLHSSRINAVSPKTHSRRIPTRSFLYYARSTDFQYIYINNKTAQDPFKMRNVTPKNVIVVQHLRLHHGIVSKNLGVSQFVHIIRYVHTIVSNFDKTVGKNI